MLFADIIRTNRVVKPELQATAIFVGVGDRISLEQLELEPYYI